MRLKFITSTPTAVALHYTRTARIFKTCDIERMSINGNMLTLHMRKPLADFCEMIEGIDPHQVAELFNVLTVRNEPRLTPARDWRQQFSDWGINHVAE